VKLLGIYLSRELDERRDSRRSVVAVARCSGTHTLTGRDMTEEAALRQLRWLGQERVLGRHVGSDRLIQAGLDALLAGVDTPSAPLLAGLGRREEPEAPELFDRLLDELGFHYETPEDEAEAAWALIYRLAEQTVDGSLDPAVGADQIWLIMLTTLDMCHPYPDELSPVAACASDLDDWNEEWDITLAELKDNAFRAAQHLLRSRPTSERQW
jgi:hypothetical protein